MGQVTLELVNQLAILSIKNIIPTTDYQQNNGSIDYLITLPASQTKLAEMSIKENNGYDD